MADHSNNIDIKSSEMYSRNNDAFHEAFIKHRKGEFDPKLDAALKKKGKKILESYDPATYKRSPINPHSVFWMVTSMAVFYYTDFYLAIRIDPRIDWAWLYPGIAFLSVTFLIGVTCVIWYHCIKGISDYEKRFPYLIPLATISFFAGMICCCIAMWSVWGWFTPIILFTLFMGIVFAMSVFSL